VERAFSEAGITQVVEFLHDLFIWLLKQKAPSPVSTAPFSKKIRKEKNGMIVSSPRIFS